MLHPPTKDRSNPRQTRLSSIRHAELYNAYPAHQIQEFDQQRREELRGLQRVQHPQYPPRITDVPRDRFPKKACPQKQVRCRI